MSCATRFVSVKVGLLGAALTSNFFTDIFGVRSIKNNHRELIAVVYLQIAMIIAVYVNWGFARIEWSQAGCFHLKEGLWKRREREREAQAEAQHSLHGLNPLEMVKILNEENNYRELFEQARKCAEVARLRELHSLHTKGPYQVCCETPGT
ncbi:hypothetical protein JHK82_012886 [Glycine max]|nr:hypothetical protein JHK82_012886 [Glycine max]